MRPCGRQSEHCRAFSDRYKLRDNGPNFSLKIVLLAVCVWRARHYSAIFLNPEVLCIFWTNFTLQILPRGNQGSDRKRISAGRNRRGARLGAAPARRSDMTTVSIIRNVKREEYTVMRSN